MKKVTHNTGYINVMELLVAEEVERQFSRVPERVSKYLRRSEVETCALNRLPALYASSEKGLQHQLEHGRKELSAQVKAAVRQALMAVQVDPIRLAQPLCIEGGENSDADAVLQSLREWLRLPNLTWETALPKIQKLNQRSKARSQSAPAPESTSAPRHKIALPPPPHRKARSATPGNQPLRVNLENEHTDKLHPAIPPSVLSTVRRTQSPGDRTSTAPAMVSTQRETAAPTQASQTSRRPGTYGIRSKWSHRPQIADVASDAEVGFEDTYLR